MLKKWITLSFLSLFIFTSCKDQKSEEVAPVLIDTVTTKVEIPEVEEFRILDETTLASLNQRIIKEKLATPLAILNSYAPKEIKPLNENYKYKVTRLNSDEGITILMLIEEGINDDALKARKILMRLSTENDILKVTQIKESYQCWEWRGAQEWNANGCE